MRVPEKELKQFIIDSGLLSKADILSAERDAKEENISLSAAFVARGLISKDDIRRIEARVLGIPFVSLVGTYIDFDTLSFIPEPIARTQNIVAFRKNGDSVEVAMLDIDDLSAIDFIKKKTAANILPRLTDIDSIKSAILIYQRSLKEKFGNIIGKEAENIKIFENKKDSKKSAEDIPAIKIVEAILKHAAFQNASDIHIEPHERELFIRYRINGRLCDAMTLPKETASAIAARVKALAGLKVGQKRLPQDGKFKIENDGMKLSMRVSVLPTHHGKKIVIRLLREKTEGFTLDYLGFHGENLERTHRSLARDSGMIVVSGPASSGKSTSLYTFLDILNTPEKNISTIEDPIEYGMQGVNQSQIYPETGFSFSDGLRSLLRQDADIIMVADMSDKETVELASNASLRGRLVLSAIEAQNSSEAISKILNMKSDSDALSRALSAVIGQRLARRLSDSRERKTLSSSELLTLGKVVDLNKILRLLREEKIIGEKDSWDKVFFGTPKPTADIADGYKGQIGIHEVLVVTPTIQNLIIQGADQSDIEAVAKKEGMITLIEDGIFKAAQGLTTVEEVLRAVSE